MPQPASIEAGEYSRWDDDDLLPDDRGTAGVAPVVDATSGVDPLLLLAGREADGSRLDKWLALRLPAYSRSRLQRWIVDGRVSIAGRVVATRDPVWAGDTIRVEPQPTDDESAFLAEDIPLDIVHEDDTLIVLDKRAGLVVHPASGNWSGTVLNGLLHHAPSLAAVPRAGIVHRLDKDTSGLMVVAKTLVAQTDLVRQLQARTVGRTYVAMVHGTPPASGRVAWAIGRDPRDRMRMKAFRTDGDGHPTAKQAATRFETLASVGTVRGKSASLVVCRLETGRTHQIRVHMQAIGHPLLGDVTYGGAHGAPAFGRQALHAWHLRLIHPACRQPMAWRADLPADMAALAETLGFDTGCLLTSALTEPDD
ncbi:MAG: RluA family pseudouridine synthase [Burkholderiaceae bacterium]